MQGLVKKLIDPDFFDYINSYDILFFTESWCNKYSNIDIQGYTVYSCPRPKCSKRAKRDSGGIAIYCKNKLIDGLEIVKMDDKGIVWLKLKSSFFNFENDHYFCVCYIPPEKSKLYTDMCALQDFDYFDKIADDIRYYNNLGEVFLCGDFNSRTGLMSDVIEQTGLDRYVDLPPSNDPCSITVRKSDDKSVNTFGYKLINLCKESELCIVNGRLEPGRFTFQSGQGNCVLDYFIAKASNFKFIKNIEVEGLTEFSDHCPINVSFSFYKEVENDDDTFSDKLFWDASKSDYLLEALNTKKACFDEVMRNDLLQAADVSVCVQNLTGLMYETCYSVFGRSVSSKPKENSKKAQWFTNECRRAKSNFLSSKRIFRKYPTDGNKTRLFADKKEFRKTKRKAERAHLQNMKRKMSDLSRNSPKQFWKKVNDFRKGKISSADKVSLNDFAEHFKHISNSPHSDRVFEVPDFESQNIEIEVLDQPISVDEISKAIDSLKRGKSPGIDGLLGDFFKDAKSFILPYLHKVYNNIFDSGVYPEIWSKGLIVPIPKKGDMSNPSNYRGITLINSFAKLFSVVIRKRVNSWCEEQSLLNDFQFGFRDKRGTADCIFVLHTLIQKILARKSKLYCAFIDYEKAFDTIIHDAMWIKLINAGLSSKIITIIKAIYNKISASVKLSHDISSCFDICLGLKQGEPLSPLLFVLFVNDIYAYLKNEGEPPSISGIDIEQICFFILMFADDMVLFAESPDELQTLLDKLYQYTTDWGLKINTVKTKVLIFQKRRQQLTRSWKLNDAILDVVDNFCYLGLKINYTGNVEFTTKALSDQALRAANGLLALFKRLSFDIKTKLSLFDSLVPPILLYGAEVWGIYNISNIDKIHIKYCKAILGVRQQTPNYAVFGELGRYPLSVICKERALNFWIKILKCDNSTSPIFHVFRHQVNELTLHPHERTWAFEIKRTLDNLGLSNFWNLQFERAPAFQIIKQRLRDQFVQTWSASLQTMSKLECYLRYKQTFEFEKYLHTVMNDKLRQNLTAFRLVSHRLEIETGRHNNIPREQRLCRICNMKQPESEYHFLLVCPAYHDLRLKYFPRSYISWPNLQKFENLMKNKSSKILNNISRFISSANKVRYDIFSSG